MSARAWLLPGTLDLLILKAVSLGPLHGYAVLLRIEQITGGALEDSNVDLTGELVNLIKAQSNYQANAKTISTQSTIMQTIIQMT